MADGRRSTTDDDGTKSNDRPGAAGGIHSAAVARAAAALAAADGLLITAGAGMAVDSGLPDFRGNEGFWRAYPPFAQLGLSFSDLANPRWFARDPALAWGFYGHRLNLYRATTPHAGFAILRGWAARARHGGFVFTSNVDGQFQRASFDPQRILECHGRIGRLQCGRDCGAPVFAATDTPVDVDEVTMRARPPLPTCPGCGQLARPNILMFDDGDWDDSETSAQEQRLGAWLAELAAAQARLAIVECGAGSAVPTVRYFSERLQRRPNATLIRINPREPEGPPGTISIAASAAAALAAIEAALATSGYTCPP